MINPQILDPSKPVPKRDKTKKQENWVSSVDVTTTSGKQYHIDRQELDWIKNRYKQDNADSYGYDVADQAAKAAGQVSAKVRATYTKSAVDQQLAQMGLPSQKNLDKYIGQYQQWHTGGIKDVFGNNVTSQDWTSLKNLYKQSWQYADTAEDQERKRRGLMPSALEQNYGDTEIDDQLKAGGLPSYKDFNTYWGQYGNQQSINALYANAAGKYTATRMTRDDNTKEYIQNDNKRYTVGGETRTGKEWYAKAFYDELGRTNEDGSLVYGNIMPLLKSSKTEDEEYIDPTESYVKQMDALFKSKTKEGDGSEFDGHSAFSYDDFVNNYGDYYDKYWKDQKFENGQTVDEVNAIIQREQDEARTKEFYTVEDKWFDGDKGITAFVERYQKDYPLPKDGEDLQAYYEGMFTDMLDHGISQNIVRKTMKEIRRGTQYDQTNDRYNAITDAYANVKAAEKQKQQAEQGNELDFETQLNLYGFPEEKKQNTIGNEGKTVKDYEKEVKTLIKDSVKADSEDEDTIAAATRRIKGALMDEDEGTPTVNDVDTVIDVLNSIEKENWNNPVSMRVALQDLGFTEFGQFSGLADDLTQGWSKEDKLKLSRAIGSTRVVDNGDKYSDFNDMWAGLLGGWARTGAESSQKTALNYEEFSYALDWAEEQIASNKLSAGEAYNILAGVGFSNELQNYLGGKWHEAHYKDVFVPKMYEQAGGDSLAMWEGMTPEQRKLAADSLWDNLSEEDKAAMFSDPSWWKSNPTVYRTFGQALVQQFEAVLPSLATELASGAVTIGDAIGAAFTGRPAMGDTAKEWQEAQQFAQSYGSVYDEVNGTKVADIVATATGEIAKMYLLGGIGGAIGEAVEGTKIGSVIAKAAATTNANKVTKFGANMFLDMVKASPFMVSSFAGHYAEAKSMGATNGEAAWYGMWTGLAEGALEGFNFDKVWGRALGTEKFGKMLIDAGNDMLKSRNVVWAARGLSMIVGGLGEYTEENLGYALETVLKLNSRWGADSTEWSEKERREQGFMGFLTGLVGAGLSSSAINGQSIMVDYWLEHTDLPSHIIDTGTATNVFESGTSDEQTAWRNGGARIMSDQEFASKLYELDILNKQDDTHAAQEDYKKQEDQANKKYNAVKAIETNLRAEMAALDPADPEYASKVNDLDAKITKAAQDSHDAALVREDEITKARNAMDTRIEQAHNQRDAINKAVRDHFAGIYLQNEDPIITRNYDAIKTNLARDRQNGAKVTPQEQEEGKKTDVAEQPGLWRSKQADVEGKPTRPFTADDEKQVVETAKKMRYKGNITFVDDPDANWEGKIHLKSGDIEINRAHLTATDTQRLAENPAMWVMEHELFHYMWNRGGNITDELRSTVREMYKKHPGLARGDANANYDKFLDNIMAKRNEQGLTVNDRAAAEEEVIADFFRNYAFRSDAAIKALCQTNGNLGQRILSWLRYKIDDLKLRRSKESWARDILKVERQYALALREAGHQTYSEARAKASEGDTRYAVKKTTENKPFVEIEEDILADVPQDQWQKTVAQEIKKRFKGGIDVNGQHVDVSGKSANEITRGDDTDKLKRVNPDVYADKLRASTNLDEITEASRGYVNEAPTHERKDDIVGFGRGTVLLRIGTNDYKADVVIGNRRDGGALFYDVVNVEPTSFTEAKTKQSPLLGDISADTNRLETAPIGTVSSEAGSVNTNERNSAAGNLTDDILNGYVGQANPDTGVTAEEDEAYMRAALAGDVETAGRMVRDMYERNGWTHTYRGEPNPTGSWTQVDMDKFKAVGMFSSPDISTARANEYTGSYAKEDLKTKPLSYGDEMPVLQQFADSVAQRIGKGMNLRAESYYMDDEGNTYTEKGKGREHHWALRDVNTGDIFADSTELATLADAAKVKAARLIGGNPQNIYNSISDPFAGRILDLFVKFDQANEHNANGDEWDKIYMNGPRGVTLYRIEVTDDQDNPGTSHVYAYPIDEGVDAESSSASERAVKSTTFTYENDDQEYAYKLEQAFKELFGPKSDVADFFFDYAEWSEDGGGTLDKVGIRDKNGRYVSPALFPEAEETSTDELAARDKAAGYDGSIIRNVRDGGPRKATDFVSFNPNYIKSADAITYDKDGNIIPLSQRGNTSVNELRYSGGLDIDQILSDMVEAQSETDQQWDEKVQEYGAKPQGQEPRARDIRTPERPNAQKRFSDFLRSLVESDKVGNDQVEAIKRKVLDEDWLSYIPVSQRERMEEARAYIAQRQPLEAQQDFHDMVTSGKLGVKTNALGLQLLSDAAARGDIESVLNIATDLQIAATEAGQSAQIFNVLKELKGVGSAWYMNGLIKKLNTKYADRIQSGKMQPITVPVELMENLSKAVTVDEIAAAEDAVAKEIARQLPLTWEARVSNWRYFSMLANPTTHFRNITGNVLMKGLNAGKDVVATGLEKALNIDESERAHSILTPEDKSAWGGFAEESYKEQARNLSGGGKLSFQTFVDQNMRKFDTKWVNALAEFNFKLLEGEDVKFIRPAYKNALMQYMKAQGFTLNEKGEAGKVNKKGEWTAMTNAQKTAAVDWASQQAWKATFRDASSLATMLNKLSKEGPIARLLVEGVMPFKKTPINIAKRGIEYSPAGIIMGTTQLLTKVKQGKMTAAEAIDNLASGITGTALMALGVALAKAGLIRAGGEKDKKLETYLEDTGDQTYAMKFGDKSINMSSIAPATIPLFMGVALNEMIEQSGETIDLSTITDTIAGTLNPFMEMSFMASLNSALKNYNNNGIGGALGNTLMTAAQNYGSQYLPTLGGKIAQFLDPTRRTTKSDATSPVGGNMDYYLRSLAKKVPGLEATLQPDVDVWGRTDVKDSFREWAWDFANKFVLPTTVKVTNRDAVDNELIRVVESTGVTDFLPSDGNKYFTVKGEKYTMNARQYSEYSQERGQAAYVAIKELMASPSYQAASDETKADMLKKAKEAAYKHVNNLWKEKLGAFDK